MYDFFNLFIFGFKTIYLLAQAKADVSITGCNCDVGLLGGIKCSASFGN